ncbi:DUF488 domain-containing protein [Acuticoccus sediminis]|uniref:DUF488 domain-containing protein n=1 Tax=Acuticoccus sediminis TaxID=2184697 RepID=UPI001CFCCC26|nr:DUF488 family protein [Acuticoccus sediminis]
MSSANSVYIARVYDDPKDTTGARLLVDRAWPRGVNKADLDHDEWIRDVAPSTELRKWFGHDPKKWAEFRMRYSAELKDNQDAVSRCLEWCRKGPVTLLFAARDREHNQAVILREYLSNRNTSGAS